MNTHQRPMEAPRDPYPFEGQWLERNCLAMHDLDEGEGVPVLLATRSLHRTIQLRRHV
jgi:hypothetical protein